MAFLQTGFESRVLGISASMNVIIPEYKNGDNPPKVLYLLHGLSDDHSIWTRRTSIERYASNKNLCVVMPAVNRSFYTDMKVGARYWTFISEELLNVVNAMFKVSDKREDTFAAGLSMGGYGAFKLGLRCSDKFSAAASLSGALNLAKHHVNEELNSIFGDKLEDNEDLFKLAENLEKEKRPRLYIACGTEDFLYNSSQEFLLKARELSYDVTYKEGPGTHEWSYWDMMIQDVLNWLNV